MPMLDFLVRSLSVAIFVLIAWQVLGRKSHPEHDNRGALVGIGTVILLLAVLARGTGSEAAGPLYVTHLVVSAPYFLFIPVVLWTGPKLRKPSEPHFWRMLHLGAVTGASISFLVSVGFGIGSYLQTRGIF